MGNETSLQFVNHASILVKHGDISLLSDPWYQGDAFHKGWNLIHELQDEEITSLLDDVTHLWISHEHPDHFSIGFFKKFGAKLKSNNIQILFQNTNDKRVEGFLFKSGYNLKIIDFNCWITLANDFEVLCFKDGFYDSGLAIKTSDKTIINLNDCEIKDRLRCEEVVKITGECDILATQFSYAAWKGGIANVGWRTLAAKEKLDTMKLQASFFKPKIIVPFASYIYFSNNANFYLNDASNKPNDVIDAFIGHDTSVNIMKPFEVFDNLESEIDNAESIDFWNQAARAIDRNNLKGYDLVTLSQLEESFGNYTNRIFKNNTKWFMRLVRYLSPISAFKPVVIRITDLDINIKLDIFSDSLQQCTSDADISMFSESLKFVLSNTFGFDTLTVNGCFEEVTDSGFSRAARTLAIENLNNMGIEFRPGIFTNYQLITMFISRLWVVSKKLRLAKTA
jgi:UDP-MurNAc hydroxylase